MKRAKGPIPVRARACATCVFAPGNPMDLRPGWLTEIQQYLLNGTSHLCHSPGIGGKENTLA